MLLKFDLNSLFAEIQLEWNDGIAPTQYYSIMQRQVDLSHFSPAVCIDSHANYHSMYEKNVNPIVV